MSLAIPMLGIIISLALLITLAYRGHSVIVAAPLSALVAVIFSGAPILATYTQVFMPALGGFIINFFPLFLLGAIFGILMSFTGLAADLAKWLSKLMGPERSILATVLATTMLTYGGVSAWVIAFTMYPIASALFREADIPKRLMPAAIALGIFTFATAALPGSPQIHNAIPTRYFETTTFAAPILGLIGAVITFALGMTYLQYRAKKMRAADEGYNSHLGEGEHDVNEGREGGTVALLERQRTVTNVHARGLLGLLPVLVVVAVNAIFIYVVPNILDFSYLQEERFGGVELNEVMGTWSVIAGLLVAIAFILVLKPRAIRQSIEKISEGAKNSVIPALTTASEVGYGAAIASLAVFAVLTQGLFGLSDDPMLLGAIATTIIAAVTGSSSGGLTIALESFGDQLVPIAEQAGMSLELLHRVMAMASVSFDSLPHNGAIITLLLVTGMTHRQSYKDIGVVTVLVPAVGVLAVMMLAAAFPGIV